MLTTAAETFGNSCSAAVKSISFRYTASQELVSLLEDFRSMCNDAIGIAVHKKPRSRFRLIELAYHWLKRYGLQTHYILSACEVAFSVYRNKNRKSIPIVRKAFLKLDNQSYQLNHMLLRIPTTPRQFVFLTLQGSNYHLSIMDDPSLKKGSITITDHSVSIAFRKKVARIDPSGYIGIDINERNVTASATNGYYRQFTGLGDAVDIRERYREIRAKIGRMTRRDRRIGKLLFAKYSRREKNRLTQRIHKITKEIVNYAKKNHFGIKMERLAGIRRRYRKGNGMGRFLRARMNSWAFGDTQRQINYKSRWEGVPDWFVNPKGTSSNCPDCGSRVAPLQDRKLFCARCDRTWDRDDLASKNIMACAVPQARPPKGSDEKERGGDGSNPRSRWEEVKTGGHQLPSI